MLDFQLDALDTTTLAAEGVRVPFTLLDGVTPLLNANKGPVGVILIGSDSTEFRKASRALARKRVERAKAAADRISDDALDQADEDELELIVTCTKGWFGVLDSKNKDIPFSAEGVRELYRRHPAARDQANEAVVNRARFTKASSGA